MPQGGERGRVMFPRLNVKETKRSGAKGPPRNRMALYEELTYPSHRVVESVGSSNAYPSQGASHSANGYFGTFVISPPGLPYVTLNFKCPIAGQSSLNGSGKSSVLDGEAEVQQVQDGWFTESGKPSSSTGRLHATANGKETTSRKRSSRSDHAETTPKKVLPMTCNMETRSKRHKDRAGQLESGLGLSGPVQENPQPPLPDNHKQSDSVFGMKQNSTKMRGKKRHLVEETSDLGAVSRGTGSGECLTVVGDDGHCSVVQEKKVRLSGSDSMLHNLSAHQLAGEEDAQGAGVVGVTKEDAQFGFSSRSSGSSGANFDHDVEPFATDSEDSSSCTPDSVPGLRITPKDAMKVLRQDFWKARKVILRQQKIFSTQVFELHRLIKVQMLMSSWPDALMGCPYFSASPALVPDELLLQQTSNANAAVQDSHEQKMNSPGDIKPLSSTCLSSSCQVGQPRSITPSSHPPINSNNGSCTVNPALGTSGSWIYPQYGQTEMNPWTATMTHNGTYMYHPYEGPFPAYYRTYQPGMADPNSFNPSIASYAVPGYDQSKIVPDMYRYRYDQQQWQAPMVGSSSGPIVTSDASSSWRSIPSMSYVDFAPRAPPQWYDEKGGSVHYPFVYSNFNRLPLHNAAQFVPSQWTHQNPRQGRTQDEGLAKAPWMYPSSACQTTHPSDQHVRASQKQDQCEGIYNHHHTTREYTALSVERQAQGPRKSNVEPRETSRDRQGRHKMENALDSRKDAVSQFPKGRIESHSSRVIKVVPHAKAATSASAAEILMAIQQQPTNENWN